MTHFTHAILTCAVILTFYAIWGIWKESRLARKHFKHLADYIGRNPYGRETMQDVTYTLYRRLRPTREPGIILDNRTPGTNGRPNAIISTMSETIKTNDPFAARLALQQRYPGWAVGADFKTATDREYAEIEFDSYPEELDSGDE